MTTIEFLFAVAVVGMIVLSWIVIDHLRRILDTLHTLAAQGSQRRAWVRKEHEG